ncbi:MAG: metal-dependent hydrolase [Tenuifilum sp.]|uniref:metal-dependent hydrolase n=1 Tax=Tenuifilum sp. TaxID=2760880 RepID=UPI001B58371A|nr:metal-dependent hydrolase [Bacteroidales bacterium]HOK86547.1 metal-dependent hydrolase [Tenuifilum sp.]HQE55521.1 metal-dependent hydrolase [Tenuifilum sp.]
MDSLTHALTGAIIGHALGNSKLGTKAMVIGAIAANIPDFDAAFTPFFDPVEAMFIHRGFSHSLLLMFIGSAFLGYLLSRYYKSRHPFGFWWPLVLIPWLSHLLMDIFNTYGTGILEPFSSVRISFDAMAIIDINLLVILVLTLAALLFLREKSRFQKRFIALLGLSVVLLYFLLNVYIKLLLEREVRDRLTTTGIDFTRIHSTPLPLTNLVWMVVVEDSSGYRVSQVNIVKKQIVSHTLLLKGKEKNITTCCSLERIKEFTKNYFTIDYSDQGYFFVNDLRFSSLESSYPAAYVLRFRIDEKNCRVERTHPRRGINTTNISKLVRKIF